MAVVENLAFVVNIVQKQIEGSDSLGQPLFDVRPLRPGDHARHQVVGKDSFRSFSVPVDVEGDALGQERQVYRALAARDFLRRKVQERLQDLSVVRPHQAVLGEHLVIGVIEDVVLQERIAERAGSGYFHLFPES